MIRLWRKFIFKDSFGVVVMSSEKEDERNLLKMRPIRDREWHVDEESTSVHITHPRFGSSVGRRVGSLFGVSPTYEVKLDEYGSAIWELCDGRKTAEEIGKALKERFGEAVEPLYPRLSKFLQTMERNKLIRYEG